MGRSIGAVVAGYMAWTVVFLGGAQGIKAVRAGVHDADGFTSDTVTLVMYLALSVLASLLAGLCTGRIAVRNLLPHGVALATCLLATGIPVQFSAWDKMPAWYHIAFLLLLAPISILGTRLIRQSGSAQMAA